MKALVLVLLCLLLAPPSSMEPVPEPTLRPLYTRFYLKRGDKLLMVSKYRREGDRLHVFTGAGDFYCTYEHIIVKETNL